MREEEISTRDSADIVMLVRMAVPAVAFRRGEADARSLKVMKERVNEGDRSSLEWAEEADRRKRASSLVSAPIFFVGMFDESPVIVKEEVEGIDVCVVSIVLCVPDRRVKEVNDCL